MTFRVPLITPLSHKILAFFVTCVFVHIAELLFGIPYTWGIGIGVALSFPYESTASLRTYFLKLIVISLAVGLEINAIDKTGVIEFLIKKYRDHVDTELIMAICVVLLLTPIIDLISDHILRPLLEKKTTPTVMKIISSVVFGLFCTFLSNLGVIGFAVEQSRTLNLDSYLITAITIMFILAPLNSFILETTTGLLRRS